MALIPKKKLTQIDLIAGIKTPSIEEEKKFPTLPAVVDRSDPSPTKVPISQSILTFGPVSKVIDILSGGQTIQQAEDTQIEQAKNLGTFFDPFVQAGKAVPRAIDFTNRAITSLEDKAIKDAEGVRKAAVDSFIPSFLRPKDYIPRTKPVTLSDVAVALQEDFFPLIRPRFASPVGAITSAIHGPKGSVPEAVASIMKGFVDPNKAPSLFKGIDAQQVAKVLSSVAAIDPQISLKDIPKVTPEFKKLKGIGTDTPLTEFERGGSTKIGAAARLAPRATMQAVETFALMAMLGIPRATKARIKNIKAEGAIRDFEADFAKIDPKAVQKTLDKQGLFPRKMTDFEKADMVKAALAVTKEKMLKDPRLGDIYAAKQTVFQKPGVKLKGKAGELFPEKGKIKKPLKISEEQYLSSKGALFMGGAEAALHRTPGGFPKGEREKLLADVQQKMKENNVRREELRKEYAEKVELGEILQPTRIEKMIETAQGDEGLESTQAARRLLEKQGIDFKKPPEEKPKLFTEHPLVKSELTPEKKTELEGMDQAGLEEVLQGPFSKAIKDEAKRLLKEPGPIEIEGPGLEDQAQMEAKAAGKGEKAGWKEERKKRKESKEAEAAKFKAIVREKAEELKRKGAMKVLKHDIIARDAAAGDFAKMEAKMRDQLERLEKKAAAGLLKEDILRRSELARLKGYFKDKGLQEKAKKELSADIKKMIKYIKDVPTKNLPIEYKDAIEEIKDSIDFDNVKLTKILRKSKVADVLKEAGIMQQVKELDDIEAGSMSVGDLRQVYEMIQVLVNEGSHGNSLLTLKKEHSFDAIVEIGVKAIVDGGGVENIPNIERVQKGWLGKSLEWKSNYLAENRPPETIIEQFDDYKEGGPNQEAAFNPLNESANNEAEGLESSYDKMHTIFKGVDLGAVLGKKVKINGIRRPLKRNEMLDIYASSFDDFMIGHLIESGVTDEMMFDIERKLTDAEKDTVHKLFEFYDKDQYDRMDKVFVSLHGKHMPKRENYFPAQKLENVGDIDAIEMDVQSRAKFLRDGVAQGFTKEQTGGKQAFTEFDFLGKVVRNLIQVEHFISHAEAIRDVSKYFRDPKIKKAIENNYGMHVYNLIDKWIRDVARGKEEGSFSVGDKLVKTIRGNYVMFALWMNMSSVMKAPASFLQGAGYVGQGNAIKAAMKFSLDPFGEIEFAKKKSVQMKHRSFSQQKELVEMMSERGIIRHFGSLEVKLSMDMVKEIKQIVREFGMLPWQIADISTSTIIWRAEYDKRMRKLGPDGEKRAIEFADKAVRRTQPQSRLVDQADVLRSNIWKKLMMIFKSQPIQNFSLLHNTFHKFKRSFRGKKSWEAWRSKETRKHSVDLFYYGVVAALAFDTLRRHRFPRKWSEAGYALLNNAFGGLLGIGDIISKTEYRWGSANAIDALWDSLSTVYTAKKAETKIKYGIKAVSQLRGYPFVAVNRALTRESVKTKIIGGKREKESGGLSLLGGSGGSSRSGSPKKLRLLQ